MNTQFDKYCKKKTKSIPQRDMPRKIPVFYKKKFKK